MHKIWHILLALLAAAHLNAAVMTQGTHCRLDQWVEDKSEKLLDKGMTILTTSGPVQYFRHGSSGPVLLVLHGAFGGFDQARLIGDYFRSEGGFSLLAVSRPGYLGTSIPSSSPSIEFTPEQQAEVMIALLDVLEIRNVSVLGFGAGAPVAFALAKNYPDRVNALVLESLSPDARGDFVLFPLLEGTLSSSDLPDLASYLLYLSERFEFTSTASEILAHDTTLRSVGLQNRIDWVVKSHDKNNLLKAWLEAMSPLSPRLPGVLNDLLQQDYWTTSFDPTGFTTPTLIVQAVNDANRYFATAQVVQQRLPNAQLLRVTGSGHFILFGPKTKSWQKEVTEFLLKNDGRK